MKFHVTLKLELSPASVPEYARPALLQFSNITQKSSFSSTPFISATNDTFSKRKNQIEKKKKRFAKDSDSLFLEHLFEDFMRRTQKNIHTEY